MEPVDFLWNWLAEILFWIYYNQTLITGLLALTVGWVTVRHLRLQMHDERRRHKELLDEQSKTQEEIRLRKLRSLKAGLPIALSEISQYASDAIELLGKFVTPNGKLVGSEDYDVEHEIEVPKNLPESPDYPASAFKVLQAIIEHADHEDAQKLHEIIAYGQIHESRFRSITSRLLEEKNTRWIVTTPNLMGSIRDSLGMRFHVDRAFDYGRETSGHIGDLPTAEKAADALMWGGQSHEIVRQYVRDNWPPNFPRKSIEDEDN